MITLYKALLHSSLEAIAKGLQERNTNLVHRPEPFDSPSHDYQLAPHSPHGEWELPERSVPNRRLSPHGKRGSEVLWVQGRQFPAARGSGEGESRTGGARSATTDSRSSSLPRLVKSTVYDTVQKVKFILHHVRYILHSDVE